MTLSRFLCQKKKEKTTYVNSNALNTYIEKLIKNVLADFFSTVLLKLIMN